MHQAQIFINIGDGYLGVRAVQFQREVRGILADRDVICGTVC